MDLFLRIPYPCDSHCWCFWSVVHKFHASAGNQSSCCAWKHPFLRVSRAFSTTRLQRQQRSLNQLTFPHRGRRRAKGQLQRWGQRFPQNQHLFYLALIWSPWKLPKKSLPVFNPLEVVCLRRKGAFKQLLFVFPPQDTRRRSAREGREKVCSDSWNFNVDGSVWRQRLVFQCYTFHIFMYVQLGQLSDIISYQKFSGFNLSGKSGRVWLDP